MTIRLTTRHAHKNFKFRHKLVLFRSKPEVDDLQMENIDRIQQCERRFLQLIADSGLPGPDEISYEPNAVRFLWEEQKVMVIVDLEDFEETDAHGSFQREGLAA